MFSNSFLARQTTQAVVDIRGSANGRITIEQTKYGYVVIRGQLTGLKPGKHGFHVHEFGDTSNSCKGAGGHYNPLKRNHASPCSKKRHVGDLGNIHANAKGIADVNIIDTVVSLNGRFSVVGRAIVVHAGEDDLGRGGNAGSLATGNAGARVGCGVIGSKTK